MARNGKNGTTGHRRGKSSPCWPVNAERNAFAMPRGRGEERAALTREVRDAFARLTRQGLDPNDAAALALKLAAGIAEWPLDVPAFLGAVNRCKDASLRSGRSFRSTSA